MQCSALNLHIFLLCFHQDSSRSPPVPGCIAMQCLAAQKGCIALQCHAGAVHNISQQRPSGKAATKKHCKLHHQMPLHCTEPSYNCTARFYNCTAPPNATALHRTLLNLHCTSNCHGPSACIALAAEHPL